MKATTFIAIKDIHGVNQDAIEKEAAGCAAPAFGPDTDPTTLWLEFPEGIRWAPSVNPDHPYFAPIVKVWRSKPADAKVWCSAPAGA
ncbi:hypothetical protein NE236_37050 [Actinoallomurus purpureus]|uniref:hypothetical protein n=1 Tax=Actinoallomurus purpureus TaxID=478114 RepID=UPI00209252EA|nr:hypothetical protein [Actinoallomurus purpureus]MCO6010581.1 hypothetical protein [Actinoallomurus purpureus]